MKTILVDAVHCLVSETGQIFAEMHALLETYPNKKIILTGANDEQFKKFGLDKMPYEVFTQKHNPEKTAPHYYQTFLKRHGLKPEDVVYFEHATDAAESAQSVGIKTHLYDREKKDLAALQSFLDEYLH